MFCAALTPISGSMVSRDADSFRNRFDEAFVYSLYGEAEHWILVRWSGSELSIDTDLFGGYSDSVRDERVRLQIIKLLNDIFSKKSGPYDPYRCSRFNVRAEFSRGKDKVNLRACLFPADTGLSKAIMTLFRFLDSSVRRGSPSTIQ
jgi:hypothetical protein